MAWICDQCQHSEHEVEEGQNIRCLNCGHTTELDDSMSEVTYLPVKDDSDYSENEVERHKSYDKKRIKLRGAALHSKQAKMVNELEPVDEGRVNTEDLKSNPTNVFIASIKVLSRKATDLKLRVHKDLLRLNRECGYSVELTCTAPKPVSGRRGEQLKLSVLDCHGVKAKCSCKHNKVIRCDYQFKETVNVGVQVPKNPSSDVNVSGLKVVTPTNSRHLASREQLGQSLVSPISGPNLRVTGHQPAGRQNQTQVSSHALPLNETQEPPQSLPPIFVGGTQNQNWSPASSSGSTSIGGTQNMTPDNQSLTPHIERQQATPFSSSSGSEGQTFGHFLSKFQDGVQERSQKFTFGGHQSSGRKPDVIRQVNSQSKPQQQSSKHAFLPPTKEETSLKSGKKNQILFSKVHPLKINGLIEKKGHMEKASEISLDKVSSAVCGVCKEEKRSKFDRAFRTNSSGYLIPGKVGDQWLECSECRFVAHGSCLSDSGKISKITAKKQLEEFDLKCKDHH